MLKEKINNIPEGLYIEHVSKIYNKRPVVRDVSLNLKRGEIVGLLGPNGAGKTTCFSLIAGLITPNSGELFIDKYNITSLPMFMRSRFGISYLPQESSIFRGLTVEENILAVLEIVEFHKEKLEKKLEELLAEFSITHLRYTPAIALSGGERRRLEIARCLATEPKYILLDEPLAGIDPVAIDDIKELVIHLKQRNIGVLITDHNVRETLNMVDRAYIIYDGKVLKEGTSDEIISNAEVQQVYLGSSFR